MDKPKVKAGRADWRVEDVIHLAQGKIGVELDDDPDLYRAVEAGVSYVKYLWQSETPVYGINTGFGASLNRVVPKDLVEELPAQMTRYHRTGLGNYLDEESAVAVLAVRLISLSKGYSGVRWELLKRLVILINERIVPLIPEEGSVGASGDLTPLSYVAAALIGEGEMLRGGQMLSSAQVWKDLKLPPLNLAPKEALALMNGTSVMTGFSALAFARAQYLSKLSARISAWAVLALDGRRDSFNPDLFEFKKHPGQVRAASWIWQDLDISSLNGQTQGDSSRLQDAYSLRCAPHVIGVVEDTLSWVRQFIEVELNSVNDNPIIDGEKRRIWHGGHFYGGHIAMAMDSLKIAVASLADLMDRQLSLLVDVRTNHGLPSNLSGAGPGRLSINHGFKAVQIATSAWAAEALKLTMPATSFSRSTECHNQDKVSMGTIAARDCLRILTLTEQTAAAVLLGAMQGLECRYGKPRLTEILSMESFRFFEKVREDCPWLAEDRPMDKNLQRLSERIRSGEWPLYTAELLKITK